MGVFILLYIGSFPMPCGLAVLTIELSILVALVKIQPCTDESMVTIRKCSLSSCAWICACSIALVVATPSAQLHSTKYLWLALCIGGICVAGMFAFMRLRSKRSRTETLQS